VDACDATIATYRCGIRDTVAGAGLLPHNDARTAFRWSTQQQFFLLLALASNYHRVYAHEREKVQSCFLFRRKLSRAFVFETYRATVLRISSAFPVAAVTDLGFRCRGAEHLLLLLDTRKTSFLAKTF
jgi:hypothetical protein